jgi:ankyrin repeat protein
MTFSDDVLFGIEKGAIDPFEKDEFGRCLMLSSCFKNDIELVELLVEHFDIDYANNKGLLVDRFGQSVFHFAAMHTDSFDLLQLLISKSTLLLNKTDQFGKTPLDYAIISKNQESIDLITEELSFLSII